MSMGIRNKIIDMSHMNVCIPEKFEQSHAFKGLTYMKTFLTPPKKKGVNKGL